jgi:hypothetical protein
MKRLMLMIVLCAVLGSGGCGSKVSAADKLAAEQKAQCFQNQGVVLQTMKLFYADTGTYPPIDDVLSKIKASCPAGGKYTFSETTEKVTCSIHGSPPASK